MHARSSASHQRPPSRNRYAIHLNRVRGADVSVPPVLIVNPSRLLLVMYITDTARALVLCVCFGKMRSDARPDQLIALTRCRHEALPIKYGDLPSAAQNQTPMFHIPGSVADGRPLDAQHFGQQALSDQQCVIVTAITHREQPTRQPLFETMRPVARYRHQDLLEKGLGVSVHEDFGKTASTRWPG